MKMTFAKIAVLLLVFCSSAFGQLSNVKGMVDLLSDRSNIGSATRLDSSFFQNIVTAIEYRGRHINDFSGVADGSTDNTTALTNALAAGNMVLLGPGVYDFAGITLTDNQVLIGQGSDPYVGGTVLNLNTDADGVSITGHDVVLMNLAISADSLVSYSSNLINITTNPGAATTQRAVIFNVGLNGLATGDGSVGIKINGATDGQQYHTINTVNINDVEDAIQFIGTNYANGNNISNVTTFNVGTGLDFNTGTINSNIFTNIQLWQIDTVGIDFAAGSNNIFAGIKIGDLQGSATKWRGTNTLGQFLLFNDVLQLFSSSAGDYSTLTIVNERTDGGSVFQKFISGTDTTLFGYNAGVSGKPMYVNDDFNVGGTGKDLYVDNGIALGAHTNPVGDITMKNAAPIIVFIDTNSTVGQKGFRISYNQGELLLQSGDDNGGFSATLMTLEHANSNVGIGTTNPSSKSLLDLTSTTKGFLPPRMTTTQMNAISSPDAGMMIYNTTIDSLKYYNGTKWLNTNQ